MKYIKLFENYQDIDRTCDQYYISNYTINEDGSIDVDEDVNLANSDLSILPLNFNKVNGYFNCGINKLTSLEGCPKYVEDRFICKNNKLTSLIGSPKYVGDYFDCENNQLTSLEGCTANINDNFYCSYNLLTTLRYFPEVKYGIYIANNPLPKEIYDTNKTYLKDIIKYQDEYQIWTKNDTLNILRFNIMMDEIKNNN